MPDLPPPYVHAIDVSVDTKCDIYVGIDFGTTYSAIAWSRPTTETDLLKIAASISTVKQWPGGANTEKIRTVLSYDVDPPRWGAMVQREHEPQVELFKLGLQEKLGSYYLIGGGQSNHSPYLTNHEWRHPKLPRKAAVDHVADYLTQIRKFFVETYLKRQFDLGQSGQNLKIGYVLTVPAIWSDKAKELTRRAATMAGLERRQLTLVAEPEAAALYCATKCPDANLKDGDVFLVCDAGGGTVVEGS